jgi:hypothetical protein
MRLLKYTKKVWDADPLHSQSLQRQQMNPEIVQKQCDETKQISEIMLLHKRSGERRHARASPLTAAQRAAK